MPPCAQTECERLTGTTEKRSTACPASAIFIAAASPASPPPTIATRICVFAMSLCQSYQPEESALAYERDLRVDADEEQQQPEGDAGVACQPLRALADDDAPVHREEPQPVGEVPDGREDADEVDDEDDRHRELARDDGERLLGGVRHGDLVEAGDEPEAEVQDVERDEEEEDHARDALDGVEPV